MYPAPLLPQSPLSIERLYLHQGKISCGQNIPDCTTRSPGTAPQISAGPDDPENCRRLILRIFTCFIIFMSKLLIISHAPSANTRKLTDAVLAGACDPSFKGVNVQYKQPLETGPEEVMAADGIILGTTENFGYMSGAMKDFFDRIFYPCLEHTEAMPYAIFVRAGQDGLGAKTSIERIVAGLNWKAVQDPLICKGETENFIEPCRQLGMLMAAGLEGSIF